VNDASLRASPWPARAVGAGSLVALVAIVEALLRAGVVNRFVIPLPSDVLAAIPRVVAEENVLRRFVQTTQEMLWAALLLALVGVAAGVALHRYRMLKLACETWIGAFAAAPIVLAYPLFLVIFGRSAATIVAIGFCAGLPAVILKTTEGLGATRAVLVDVGRSFRLTPRQQFRLILLPAALPTIFVGFRLGLIFAMINIVGVEFLINFGGLGQLINEMAERYDLPGTYAAILFVVLASVLFFDVTERIERWARRT